MRPAALALLAWLLLAGCGTGQAGARTSPRPPAVVPSPSPTPSPSPSPPPVFDVTTAAGVTAALNLAVPALASPPPGAATVADYAVGEQEALLAIEAHPAWRASVFAGLDPAVAAPVKLELRPLDDLVRLNPPYATTPPWRVVDPASLVTLQAWYAEAETRYGVPWRYLAAINFVETQFGRINADSRTGAQGPMQFEPATWARYGSGDVHDPQAAILAAAKYLHASGAPGRMDAAIYSYNPTELYVDCVDAYAQIFSTTSAGLEAHYDWRVYTWTSAGLTYLP